MDVEEADVCLASWGRFDLRCARFIRILSSTTGTVRRPQKADEARRINRARYLLRDFLGAKGKESDGQILLERA